MQEQPCDRWFWPVVGPGHPVQSGDRRRTVSRASVRVRPQPRQVSGQEWRPAQPRLGHTHVLSDGRRPVRLLLRSRVEVTFPHIDHRRAELDGPDVARLLVWMSSGGTVAKSETTERPPAARTTGPPPPRRYRRLVRHCRLRSHRNRKNLHSTPDSPRASMVRRAAALSMRRFFQMEGLWTGTWVGAPALALGGPAHSARSAVGTPGPGPRAQSNPVVAAQNKRWYAIRDSNPEPAE